MDQRRLEAAFDTVMLDVDQRAKSEAQYNATLFFRMLHERRGVATARALINSTSVSLGDTELQRRGRLDLTVEGLVVENPRWHPLFAPDEIDRARRRLAQYGSTPRAAPTSAPPRPSAGG